MSKENYRPKNFVCDCEDRPGSWHSDKYLSDQEHEAVKQDTERFLKGREINSPRLRVPKRPGPVKPFIKNETTGPLEIEAYDLHHEFEDPEPL